MCIIDHRTHAQCFIHIQRYIYKYKKARFWTLDNATELTIYKAHLTHPSVIINNSCALFLSHLLQSSYYSDMTLYIFYINNLHKLHTNVFRLHHSSLNFHSCCYFYSQTWSLSTFLPSVNVFNLILVPIILLGVVIHFPWFHLPISWNQDVSRYLKDLKHGFPYDSHLLCNDQLYLHTTKHSFSSIPKNIFGCYHYSFCLKIFFHNSSSKIHLLSFLMDMKDSSLIVFLELHIVRIYDQSHHRWSTSMCDSWQQNVQFCHMSNI